MVFNLFRFLRIYRAIYSTYFFLLMPVCGGLIMFSVSTCVALHARRGAPVLPRSRLQSGQETPLQYATEDTPAVFSRNDSLSSLEFDEGAGAGLPGNKGNTVNQLFTEELRRICGKGCEGLWQCCGNGSESGSGSGSFYHHAKTVRKTLIPTVFVIPL
jgi:hypothetical protein